MGHVNLGLLGAYERDSPLQTIRVRTFFDHTNLIDSSGLVVSPVSGSAASADGVLGLMPTSAANDDVFCEAGTVMDRIKRLLSTTSTTFYRATPLV